MDALTYRTLIVAILSVAVILLGRWGILPADNVNTLIAALIAFAAGQMFNGLGQFKKIVSQVNTFAETLSSFDGRLDTFGEQLSQVSRHVERRKEETPDG